MSQIKTYGLNPLDPMEVRIIKANKLVEDWMSDPENREFLNDLKLEAMYSKGMSKAGNIRHKHIIPEDAFITLPVEISKDKKLLNEWITRYHPYLYITDPKVRK